MERPLLEAEWGSRKQSPFGESTSSKVLWGCHADEHLDFQSVILLWGIVLLGIQ